MEEMEQLTQEEVSWTGPAPDEWYTCSLKSAWPEKRFIVGELSTGDLVWIHERDVTYSPGAHKFCLPVGTEMSVRMEFGRPGSAYQYAALECQIGGNFEPVRESVIVELWRDKCGSVKRNCGCAIFARVGSKYDDEFFDDGESFPTPNRGARLKQLLFGNDRPDFVARNFQDRDILFSLATTTDFQVFDFEALSIEGRITRLCASKPDEARWLLRQLFEATVNDFGDQILSALIVHMNAEMAIGCSLSCD